MKKIITILLSILLFTSVFAVEKSTNTQKSQSKEITLIPDVNSDDSAEQREKSMKLYYEHH